MSTEICVMYDANNCEIIANRFCRAATNSDRIGMQITIIDGIDPRQHFQFNRESWKEFRDKVDQAFNDYPYTKP